MPDRSIAAVSGSLFKDFIDGLMDFLDTAGRKRRLSPAESRIADISCSMISSSR
jgi:hypothetical protein